VVDKKPTSEAIVELVRYKCIMRRCRGNSSCLVAGTACTQMGRCDGHTENCDNVDLVLHNDDEENDEDRTVYSDNTVIPTSYSILASSSGVHEHEDIDNIVHLSEM